MARHLRLEYAGAVYHVTARGNDRSSIFHTEDDRRHLLEVLAVMMERYAVVLHAYVLMNNHYHLVVRTLEPNLSRFMHDVNTGFSVWTNTRNRRTGHVFEGRFKAIAMQEDGYLRSVSAYVHLNPVRVRGWRQRSVEERLARVTEYPWSSFRDYTQRQPSGRAPEVICTPVWGALGARTEREGRWRYRDYVRGWLLEESENPLADVQRGCYLGGAEFAGWIERLLVGERPISDQVVAHRQWRGPSITIPFLLERISALWGVPLAQIHSRQRPNEARDAAVYLCREVGAKPVREIGAALGIKSAAVSLAAKRMRQHLAEDRELRKKLETVKNALINV